MERELPYNSFNAAMRRRFGKKMYKLSLRGDMTCPNRDGTVGTRGCVFCSAAGAGEFAAPRCGNVDVQIQAAKEIIGKKGKNAGFIGYFQDFTNTYGPVQALRQMFFEAISHKDIEALAIATRPDCLGPEIMELLRELNEIKPVWVELGLQTVHESTARYIRRGYDLPVFEDAVEKLGKAGIEAVVHMIIGLPGETEEMIYETAEYISSQNVSGVKFHMLYIQKGADIAREYLAGGVPVLTLEEYIHLLEGCVLRTRKDMVIHRLTGDGDKRTLIAPLWSGDKKRVLNAISRAFEEDKVYQGALWR